MTLLVALIGLGEVGQILADDLAMKGLTDVTAYDVLFADSTSAPFLADVPGRKCASTAEAVANRDLVISAVTAASGLDAAEAASEAMPAGAFFLDLNSVSPGRKRAAAALVNKAGGRYVEAAVMAPFAPKRIGSTMLLGGPHAHAFLDKAQGLFAGAHFCSEHYGQAAATKMCRSVIVKGLETLLCEAMLAARYYGVEGAVLTSLSDMLPVEDWNRLATYMISRTLAHGKRRGEEMREAAAAVAEAGVAPLMSEACAVRQDWSGRHKAALAEDLGVMLDRLLADKKNESIHSL